MSDLKCKRCNRTKNTMVTYHMNLDRTPLSETYCLGCAPSIGAMVNMTAPAPIPNPGRAGGKATPAKKKPAKKKPASKKTETKPEAAATDPEQEEPCQSE